MTHPSEFRVAANNAFQTSVTENGNKVWSPEGLVHLFTKVCIAANPASSLRKKANALVENVSEPNATNALKRYVGVAGNANGFDKTFYKNILSSKNVLVEEDISKLNDLVLQLTEGMVNDVVDSAVCSTAFVVQTFKDTWMNDMTLTTLKFKQHGNVIKNVDAITGPFSHAFKTKGKNQTVIAMPYASGCMAVVILPNSIEESPDFSELWMDDNWSKISLNIDDDSEKAIYLPKFKCLSETELNGVMATLGINELDGIFNLDMDRDLSSKQVTFIEVDEIGTKAAAYTDFYDCESDSDCEPEVYVIDRPFGFAVTDPKNGTIEFAAYIKNP